MTFIELEYENDHQREPIRPSSPSIRCSWCDEVIQLDGRELALSMCHSCFERMLADYARIQQAISNSHPTQQSLAATAS